MRRQPSALALRGGGVARFLPWTIALKTFFAALALAVVLAFDHMAAEWRSGAFAVVTVELPSGAAPPVRAAARDVMRQTPGIAAAELIPADDVAGLLQSWLGSGDLPADLPLPVLIDVQPIPGAAVDWAEAEGRLIAAVPDAVLDTGMAWVERLIEFARLGQLLAILVVGMVAAVAVFTIIFATRSGLGIHRDTVELLHVLGAHDSYVAAEFQRQALWLGLRGGLYGVTPAAAALLALGQSAQRLDAPLLPDTALGVGGWTVLALLPVATGLLAMLTARYTVLRDLARPS